MMKEGEEAEDSEEFYQEMEEEELATLKKHMRSKKGSRGTRNNSATETLYKEALMDSIFGRFQEASKKLKHMITLSPDSPEPYHLLGNMHEENGELDKAAEYLFMSTYLSPPNLEKWLKVGDLSFERKMYSQAAYCFGRALKIASCDPKIMVRRAEAFELAGQFKKAIATYKRLLTISSSPDYIKKYAKLRYKRGEYLMCREILMSVENYLTDAHLIYMICETHLQEQAYEKTAKLLEDHLEARSEQMQEQETLPAEFIVILLICSVALSRDCYGFGAETLIEEVKKCYEDDFADLYSSAVSHLSRFNAQVAFSLTRFLISFPQHQTVNNYVIVIDYLCRLKDDSCLPILEEALEKQPRSPELLAERDYVFKYFGIGHTFRDPGAIFYSDEDEPAPQLMTKRPVTEHPDSQVMDRLITNVSEALRLLVEEIGRGSVPGVKEQEAILDGLEFFISLAPGGREEEAEERQGLYIKKGVKRRSDGQAKSNAMSGHLGVVTKYFQHLVMYLSTLLAHKQWRKLIQVGEKVSKVHMFKNNSKSTEFVALKIQIYEMAVLSCLAVSKFSTALFFMRYLVTRHPQDSLYALAMHLLMRICPKKTFLSSALSKRLLCPGGEHLARLLAVEYMETGCFELAISAILRSSHGQGSLGATPQLCLAACLLQLASSRNTFNKLDLTNRSAFCLASYQSVASDRDEVLFNRGRWFAQVKLNHKAIECFQQVLASQAEHQLKQRAAYCLINIYRDCDEFIKADDLSTRFFPIDVLQPANSE